MMPHLQRQKQQENYQHLRRLPDPPGILRYVYDDRNNNIDTIASYHNGNTNKYCNNENLLKKSSLSSPSNSRFRGLDPIATPTTTPTGRKASTEMFNDNYINQIVKEKEEELVSVSINTFKNSNNTKSTSSGKYGVKNIRMDSNHNDHNSYNIRYHHHNYNSHNDNSNTTDDSSLTASLSDTTMSSLTIPPAEQYHKHHENERIHDDMQSFTINDYSSDSKEIGQTGKFRTCSANVIKRSASWINAISHEPGSDNIIINKTHSKATGGVTPTTSDGPKQKILHDKNTIDNTVTLSLNMVPTTPTTINKNSDGRLAGFDKNYFGNGRTTNNSNSETTSNSCSRSSCNNDTSINTTRQRSHWLPISTASGIVALASINGLYGDITTTNPTAATPVIRRCNNRLFYNIIEKGRNKNTQKETTTRSPPCGNSSKSSTSSRSHTARTNGTAATTTKRTETTIARHIARLQSYQYNEKYCRILFRNVIRCVRALHQHDVIHCNLHIDNILIIDGSVRLLLPIFMSLIDFLFGWLIFSFSPYPSYLRISPLFQPGVFWW